MRVTVIGAGAMGGLIGGRLFQAGHEVTLVSRNRATGEAIAGRGLILTEGADQAVLPLAVRSEAGPGAADLVVIMVKADDTAAACRTAVPAVGPDTAVLTLQNGLGNVEAILATLPGCHLLAGTTTQGSRTASAGEVVVAGRGLTELAALQPADADLAVQTAALLDGAGLAARAVSDPWPLIWNKLAINAVINPVAALLGCTNGQLLELAGTEALAHQVLAEVASVAATRGASLATDWPAIQAVLAGTRANQCSMLQDLRRGRRTEIRALNGAVARYGEAAGIWCPVNSTLSSMIVLAEQAMGIFSDL